MLEIENHWVIDALIGDRDPFLMYIKADSQTAKEMRAAKDSQPKFTRVEYQPIKQ